jgi:hypothetical protein
MRKLFVLSSQRNEGGKLEVQFQDSRFLGTLRRFKVKCF